MTNNALLATATPRLLRNALRVDAIASGATGIGFLAAGRLHADLFGLPVALTLPTGLFLLAFAAFVGFTATRPEVNLRAVRSIIVLNLGWVLLSAAVLATGLAPLTALGTVYVLAQAAAVGLLAELQFIGVRRARR
ncbi:hypothetical protein [Catellatospora coxensis]|uniref:Integral membrane protein n=1 Tax=Catellatospora coxensis TaxID=310354 RepID=A0A8J3P5G0_9ACTN|nr:hypothetical protein [Catellatospora coxensis]GIG04773.1 hypothetical protein Cco03nite_14730 [Catellatospora coxensis]